MSVLVVFAAFCKMTDQLHSKPSTLTRSVDYMIWEFQEKSLFSVTEFSMQLTGISVLLVSYMT